MLERSMWIVVPGIGRTPDRSGAVEASPHGRDSANSTRFGSARFDWIALLISERKSSIWRRRLATLLGSLGLLVAVLLMIAAIGWAKYRQMQTAMSAPPPPEMPVAVELFDPRPTTFRRSTVVVGTALAHRSVTLRNEETGVVTAVAMQPGGNVKTGDLLLQIDDRTEQALLKAAIATLKQSLASLDRAKKLQLASANSAEELELAQADAQRAEAEIERLQVSIDRKRITAKFDARVGLFDLHVGQYLDAGTDIVALEGIADYLYVDFSVPAHVADRIALGDRVIMRSDTDSPSMSSRIIAMDVRADLQSRSMMVRARLDSPPPTLVPGDSILVTVEYGEPLNAVVVPQTAVRRDPAGTSVFLAVESAGEGGGESTLRAKSVPVELAGSDGTMSRIADGLSLDDRVVTDGSFKVFDGSLLGPVSGNDAGSQAIGNDAGSQAIGEDR